MSNKKNGYIIQILKGLNLLLIIITGISFAAPYFPPATFWPFIFLGMGFPILILCNIAFLLFWLYMKKWYFILSLMCIIMSWGGAGKFIGNPFKSTIADTQNSIKIMTFNAQGGYLSQNKSQDQFTSLVLDQQADIVCFQELEIGNKRFEKLKKAYPYSATRISQSILSKYPIEESKDLKLEKIKTSNGALWANIKIKGQTIRVYNLHLHSNRISSEVNELSENTKLNELNDKKKWVATKGILSQVKHAAAIRGTQSNKVKKSINSSPHPIILCGDFNDPPQSYTYRILSKNLKDSFSEAGKGFGFTYNGNIPFLKIDYILSSPSIGVSTTKIISSKVSDHKPIVSTLVLPTK